MSLKIVWVCTTKGYVPTFKKWRIFFTPSMTQFSTKLLV